MIGHKLWGQRLWADKSQTVVNGGRAHSHGLTVSLRIICMNRFNCLPLELYVSTDLKNLRETVKPVHTYKYVWTDLTVSL